jgi:hypothetical protein
MNSVRITFVVYQAYRPSIGAHALTHGAFGGDFCYSRMSWIKSNFLGMMYRSGWGSYIIACLQELRIE